MTKYTKLVYRPSQIFPKGGDPPKFFPGGAACQTSHSAQTNFTNKQEPSRRSVIAALNFVALRILQHPVKEKHPCQRETRTRDVSVHMTRLTSALPTLCSPIKITSNFVHTDMQSTGSRASSRAMRNFTSLVLTSQAPQCQYMTGHGMC